MQQLQRPHLHDHVQQALPPLHVPRAHQGKGHGRVEVRSRDVGKGVDCRLWAATGMHSSAHVSCHKSRHDLTKEGTFKRA
jgi:hypothetical protein